MQQITGKTKLLGVIGDPVEHSLSPVMHNCALAELKQNFVYLPFPIPSERLEVALAGFEAISLMGFNVTIPHKQAIIPLLAEVSPVAQMVGAVNTVWRSEKGWKGTNTDVEGFIAPLMALQYNWKRFTPVVLGNGGAARAVVAGCAELGCQEIHVVGRKEEKLLKFKESWQKTPLANKVKVHPWKNLPLLVSSADLVVNTTPVGMYPAVENSPLNEESVGKLKEGAIAYDLIYNPRPTLFLKQAQDRGCMIIDGTEMLVQQGAAALQIWLQQPIPVKTMREALLAALMR